MAKWKNKKGFVGRVEDFGMHMFMLWVDANHIIEKGQPNVKMLSRGRVAVKMCGGPSHDIKVSKTSSFKPFVGSKRACDG